MLALSDLLTAVTPDQAEQTILGLAKQLGLPVTSWQPGGIARQIIKIVARVYAAFTAVIVLAVGGGFLDYSAGGWLTLLAKNVYNVTRIEARFAAAKNGILLTSDGSGIFVIDPGDLTFSATINGQKKLYRNTSGGTLNPIPGATVLLDIQAVEVGSASNAAAGMITTLETVMLGVTCTNRLAVLGQDEETDAQLRDRCRDSLGALSPNGPKQAYRFFAKSATFPDGTSCGVTRVKLPKPPGDGSLTVIVAGNSGAIQGTVGDLNSPLGIVDDDIQNKVVPEGVGPVTVMSASNRAIDITATVLVDSSAGLTDTEVRALVNNTLLAYFPTLPIGGFTQGTGKIFINSLIGVIESASQFIVKADISLPAADVLVAPSEVPVLGARNINVARVDS